MALRAFDGTGFHHFVDVAHVSSGHRCVHSTHWTIGRFNESRCRHWNHIVLLHIVDDQLIGKFQKRKVSLDLLKYFFFVPQMPLVGLLNRPKILLAGLVSVYILTRATFVVSHLDFPYSDNPVNPTPQRQFITVSKSMLFPYF